MITLNLQLRKNIYELALKDMLELTPTNLAATRGIGNPFYSYTVGFHGGICLVISINVRRYYDNFGFDNVKNLPEIKLIRKHSDTPTHVFWWHSNDLLSRLSALQNCIDLCDGKFVTLPKIKRHRSIIHRIIHNLFGSNTYYLGKDNKYHN